MLVVMVLHKQSLNLKYLTIMSKHTYFSSEESPDSGAEEHVAGPSEVAGSLEPDEPVVRPLSHKEAQSPKGVWPDLLK